MRKITITALILLLIAVSCKQREKNLEFLEDEIVKLGYTGKFEKPSGGFQRIALELVGVEDFLAFKGDNSFVIFEMKPGNDKETIDRIESVLNLVEGFISEKDRKNIADGKERLRKQSFQQGNILILWEDEKPDDLVKVIRRNF